MALPFPKREGEVGCEALSSRPHEHWQSNNIGADDAETPPAGHAATASDEQSTDAKIFHISVPACNVMAGCCEQFSISSGYQSIVQRNGPTTCNAASKRKARSEGPRPRGPSRAGHLFPNILTSTFLHICCNRSFIMLSKMLISAFLNSLSYGRSGSQLGHQYHVKSHISHFCPKGPPE